MRIGLFTDDFLPRTSGVVTSLVQLRKGLEELGHDVYIIAPKYPSYSDNDPSIIRLPSINPLIFQNVRIGLPRSRVLREIINLNLDIVHSATQFNAGIIADYIARKIKVPHLTTYHTLTPEFLRYYPLQTITGYMVYTQLYQLYFKAPIKLSVPRSKDLMLSHQRSLLLFKRQVWNMHNMFLNNIDLVITPSNYAKNLLVKHGTKTRIEVVKNGIDLAYFKSTKDRKFVENGVLRVLTVGRLSAEKRTSTLIKAIVSCADIEMDIIGDGPDMKECVKLVKTYNLDSRVRFHGFQTQDFTRKKMHESDIFALSSYRFDSQGIVLIEAAAAQLPIVYCDGALNESVSSKNSLLVGPKPNDFKRAFVMLKNNPEKLLKMSQPDAVFLNEIDYRKNTLKILHIYEKLIYEKQKIT